VKFPVLVSYAYARNATDEFSILANDENIELLLDSGAFTAKNSGEVIRLDDYCGFLDDWGDKIFRYLALDVVGDPKATDANLKQMLRRGYNPVPVHVLGDDQRRMDELFEYSDYVALAGLRRPHKGGAPKEYVAAKMKWAAGRNVHWLGYVREPMIAAFRPFSCDSASWMSAALYGRMDVYLGMGKWKAYTFKDRAKVLRCRETMKMLSSLGYTPKQVMDENCWRRAKKHGYVGMDYMSFAVSSDGWVRYCMDIMRRYGTRVFLATTMVEQDMEHLKGSIDRHANKLNLDTLTV
jgi:hypothetical protein